MKIFFDSSAMAKRYVVERGSEQVQEVLSDPHEILVSLICLPEIFSVLNRLRREKLIDSSQYTRFKKDIAEDFRRWKVCLLSVEIIHRSVGLLEKHPLRAMDALHLACALSVQTELFVTSDIRQLSAARKEKLKVLRV